MSPVLDGVKVGPLDPDRTESFGQVSQHHNARRLIRLHSQMYPPALTRALSRKLDVPRTEALQEHLDEVEEYLRGLTLENGDPVLADDCELEGAQVRGERDRDKVLTFTYRVASGRSTKWFAPYTEDAVPDAFAEGTERTREAKMRERGIVAGPAYDSEGTRAEIAERQLARVRRENDALRRSIEGGGDVELGERPDTRRSEAIDEDVQQIRRENVELKARLSQLEALVSAIPGGAEGLHLQRARVVADGEVGAPAASEDEPSEGYDELNAEDARKLIADEDASDERVEAILAYERRHANRATVVKAAEKRLNRADGD